MNGSPVTINNSKYEIGTTATIAGKLYRVWNTLPELKLVNFAKVKKNGEWATIRPENLMTLSFEQVAKFETIGAIVKS